MITFQLEPWGRYYGDPSRAALWQEHYEYLALAHKHEMEMSPDVASYELFEKAGMLQIIVARESGLMVGYSLFLIKRHLHYSALCGFEDSYFLTASSRNGLAGYKLLAATLKAIWARGCQRAYFMTKEFASVAALLERLGGEKMDEVYCFTRPKGVQDGP